MDIIKRGKIDTYEFTCPVCGSVFRANTDECDRLVYSAGIPCIEVRCSVCCLGNCSKVLGDCVKDSCANDNRVTTSSDETLDALGICTDDNVTKFINM